MSNLDLSQFSPLGLDSLDSIGAIEPITPQKKQSGQSSAPKPTGNITEFVKNAGPAAARVAKNLGVPVEAVLGQWGLETGWGKSVIPGTNNLGNIKDFSGKGVAATDNMTGSRDRYRQYGSVDEFADDFSRLLKNKRYSAALGSQDAETYFSILKQGGYAEDPSYVQKGKHAASLVSEAIKKAGITELSQSQDRQGQQAKQKGGGLSDVTPWNVIEQTPQYKGLSDEEKTAAKELYFDRLISPHIDQSSAIDMRKRFLERKDREGGVSFWDIAKGIVENHLPYKPAMEGFTPDSSSKREPPSPANTDARRQIEAVWDAASKDERAVLEKRQDWVGDIARSKAQSYKGIDRSINTVPGLTAKVAGGLSDLDTRVESRTSRLIGAGENPIAAKRMAIDAARVGANPGMETSGSASPSDFDFDTARLFDPNAESNGLNNALVRGLAKGGAGAVKSLAGVAQSGYDLLRLESKGDFAASVGDWARNKESAIGERGDFLTRNFEGAVNSLSQQLPLLIAGVATGSAAIPLAGIAVQSFGREYSDSRAKGQSGDKAAARAAIFAAFEVVGERFGLKHNMDAIRAAADGMPTDQVLSFLAGALKREIPGELLTTTGQFATDKWAPRGIGLRPDYTSEDYLAQVADTIAQTVMQSGMMTAGTTGMAGAVRYMNGGGASQPQSGIDLGSAPQDVQQDGGIQQGDAPQAADAAQETTDMAQPSLDVEANPIAQPVAEGSLRHPSEEVADKIVQEMAEAAGVPLDIVLPAPQQTTSPEATDGEQVDSEVNTDISDADVLQLAAARARELTGRRDGIVDTVVSENGLVDVEEAGGLTEAESKELGALVAAGSDIQKIKALYGLNQTESNNDQAGMEAQQAAPISAVQADAAPVSTPQQDQQQSAQPEIRQLAPRAKEPNPQELDLSQRTDEELAFYARNARSPQVLKAVAQERERRRVAQKEDGKAPEPAEQKGEDKKPKTEKERNQMANYDDKWFMSKEKAEAFIRRKRINETHEAVSGDGGKFLIKRKADHLRDATKMIDVPANQGGTSKTTVAGRNEPKVDQVESGQQDGPAKDSDQVDVIALMTRETFNSWKKQGVPILGVVNGWTAFDDKTRSRVVLMTPYNSVAFDSFEKASKWAKKNKAVRGRSYRVNNPTLRHEEAEPKPETPKVLADSEKEQSSQSDAATQKVAGPKTEKEARERRDADLKARNAIADLQAGGNVTTRDGQDAGTLASQVDQSDGVAVNGDAAEEVAPEEAEKDTGAETAKAESGPPKTQGNKTEQDSTEQSKPSVSANVIFTEDAAAKARELLKRKLNGSTLNSGIDPEVMQAGITLAGYHIEKGARTFAAYAKAMVSDLGDVAKPYLKSWYMGVKYDPRASGFDGMDSAAVVDELDIDTIFASKDKAQQEESGNDSTAKPKPARNPSQGERNPQQRPSLQPGATRQNQEGVAAEPAQNDETTTGPEDSGRSGTGAADGDVGVGGGLQPVGDAADGRTRAGGKRVANAGSGKRARVSTSSASNYHIADPEQLIGGTPKVRFSRNKAAIEAYQSISSEGRQPTKEELDAMAAYIGWGSFGQELFKGTYEYPRPKDGWQAESDWIREHLGKDGWESAQRSIINAHYTDPITVGAMWDMVRQLGFTGGKVLEPSMGVGNFFGLMPRDLKNSSRLTGIEMEQTTGGMAKILYPDANIQIKPYQDSKTADGFYDLVIGNWPFAKDGPADRRYMSLNPSLHDYFFLKALDQTREGGIVIGITSAGTMDKKNSLVRAKMAEKADLIAAYRLPSGAFEKYAGTSVVTDIIILKRRDNKKSSASDSGWLRAVEVKTPDGAVTVNEYFANNPDKILGQLGFGSGSTYGRPSMIVRRPDDLEKRLTGIAKTLPAGVFEPQTTESITDRFVTNNIADRDMAVVVSKDGRLMQIQGEYLAPLEDVVKNFKLKDAKKTKAREQQIAELVSIRRLYGELVDSERDGLPDTEKKRTSLRDAHAKFVKAHGPITKSTGLSILKKAEDPFFPVLAALESPDGTPAAIMSKPTVRSQKQIDNPSVTDALVLARNESLNISMSRIAQIAGVSEDVAAKELVGTGAVFKTPSGNYEIADVYLSGNVRRKLREAEDALEQGDTDMKRNIAALKEVVPEDIPYFNIEAKLGATWVGADAYVEFFSSLLGVAPTSAIDVRWAVNRWKVKLSADLNARPEATTTWGHQSVKFDKILNAAMGNTTITIKYKDDEGNLVVDEDASAEVAEKIGKVRDEFSSWLWSDPVRKIEMEQAYNEAMNAIALPRFDGSFLTFAGMALQRGESPFNLRKHQVDAIWRGLANGRSLNAHEVGTGKTYTMGGLAVESRRYGIAKKPLIFAHNANSSSVAREISEMYPGAKLLYVDNLAPERVPTVLRQIANDDWDAIIVPHSVIDKFTLKKETLLEISQEQINALEMEAIDAASEDGSSLSVSDMNDPEAMKKVRSSTAKQLVHARNAIIKKIEDMALKSSKENAVSFEDMGVDMIIVDEAHEFKKPSIATRMKMKGLNTSPSSKSISLMFLTDYVKKKNGGRGVHLFTGTPITNTLSEIYNMMRYIMDAQMEKDGIKDWDAWFNTFADSTSDVELTATGEYEPVSRLASFVNVSELRRMIGQYMDIVFADDMPEFKPRNTSTGKTLSSPDLTEQESNELLNGRSENPIGRPYKKVVTDVAEMTPDQSEILSKLQGLAAKFKSATKKERREIMLRGGPESPVLVETAAANAGLDARLYDITAKDTPLSKVNRATARILHHYNEHPLATQVVFVERGFSDSSESRKKNKETGEVTVTVSERFNLVSDLIDKLERGGIPREQIAIVDGSTSKEKRKAIADAMNRAEIRVVIGNSRTLGVGVNMQTNLRAMHHLDAPWMPGDLEQRNGRGHRQGNKWNTVLEYRYLTERIDGRRWQVLSVKDRFIKAFLKAKSDVRVIDGDALSSEGDDISSTLSEAAGDPRLLMLNKLRSDVLKLEAKERMHAQAIFDAKNKIKQINREIADNEGRIKRFESADAAFRSKVKGDLSVVVKGVTHKDTEAANNALKIAVDSVPSPQMEPIKLGSIWGFEMEMIWRSRMDTPRYMVTVDGLMVEFGKPTVESVRQKLYGLQNTVKQMKEKNDESLESLPRLEEATKAPFARADDLKRKKDLFNSIQKDIQVNPVPAPSWLRNGAPVGVEVFVSGKPVVVEGHRWTGEGYFVTVTDQDATRDVDYLEVKDAAGFGVYDAHPFASPEVKQQADAPAALRPAGGVLPASRRMSAEEIGGIVADRLAKFPRRPDVSIRESVADVAPWLEAGSAAGAVIDGKIYLFRDALASAEDVTETLWHEILHYGVRKVLSKQGFIAEMSKLYQADPTIKAAADTWMKTSEASRVSQLHGAAYARAMAVEEAVADVAGSGKANSVPTSVFDAIVGWALKVADRLGFSAFAKKHRGKTGIDAREFVRGIFGQIQSGAADKAIVSELVIEPAFLMGQVRDGLVRYFGETQQLKTFSAYHKTLATQYHKAQIDKHYGKVFTLVTDMQNHVSLASIRPAELAASVLPRADSVKESLKTLVKGRSADDPILKAADAIFAGTLNGKGVLDGKVWSDDELRSKFSMNDSEIAVYRQVRSAIDASLDELAAAEAFAVAQSFIPPEMRKAIVDNPSVAQESIVSNLTSQEKVLKQVVDAAKKQGDEESAKRYAAQRDVLLGARRRVNKIFAMSNKLKLAGYAPLMRFGEFTVTVEATDPNTGEVLRTNGKSVVEYFGKYDTESEALAAKKEMEEAYRGRDFKVSAGVASRSAHELYAGVSPETVAIFGEAVGAGEIAEKYYQLVLSERNALKRRIGRKGIAGYSEELPRVLSNFITSNARFAAQRLYLRDINSTIKSIPREKGDVLDEAIAMKKFVLDPNDPAAPVSSAMFAMFLGGSISAALVNMSQPMMMTAPYLSQFGQKIAATAITKAIPFALGKKQADEKLREALKRASQEGVVDAQEVFHLYSLGGQALSSIISGSLSKIPLVGGVARRSSASVKARAEAFMTLWGSMFSIAESFNRRLTFVAAWDVALKIDDPDPYAFAVRAVNETQGIYNKVNRPNWARNPAGRILLTFKQYSIGYLELISRMWKRGGPGGKKAVLVMLGVLLLMSGLDGLPFAQDLDDLIDTIGQLVGFDTNVKRTKMELAHELLGKEMGNTLLYGVSALTPIDLSGRLGLGNLIPGTALLKPSGEQGRARDVLEVVGPAGGLVGQVADAYDAATEGNYGKAAQNLSPKAVRDAAAAIGMVATGQATDARGRKVIDVSMTDAAAKAIGFNPTIVANQHRKSMPLRQDAALQRKMESSIAHQWAAGIVSGDQNAVNEAIARRDEWNRTNPRTKIIITPDQVRSRVKQMKSDKAARVAKSLPKEMAIGLDSLAQ